MVGLFVVLVDVIGIPRGAAADKADPAEKDLRVVIRDVRGYRRGWTGSVRGRRRKLAARLRMARVSWRRSGPRCGRRDCLYAGSGAETESPADQDAAPFYRDLIPLLKEQPLHPKLYKLLWEMDKRVTHSAEWMSTLRMRLGERQDVMALVHQWRSAGLRPALGFGALDASHRL